MNTYIKHDEFIGLHCVKAMRDTPKQYTKEAFKACVQGFVGVLKPTADKTIGQ